MTHQVPGHYRGDQTQVEVSEAGKDLDLGIHGGGQ